MFSHLSIPQALDVYDDLVQAYFGVNRYARDIAEIYTYRLTPSSPAAEANAHDALQEQGRVAAENLQAVIDFFTQRYPEAKVHIELGADWLPPKKVLNKPLFHRAHVWVEGEPVRALGS